MEYDVLKAKYKVEIIISTGEVMDFTQYVTACTWSDPANEVAARASITFAQDKTDKGYINLILKLGTLVFIYANGQEVFRGVLWDWDYHCTGGQGKSTNIIAYDRMIYAVQSKDNTYLSPGMSTGDIVNTICGRWGIPVNYQWENHTHAKIVYKNKAISEQVLEILEDAARKKEKKYVAYMEKDSLQIKHRGTNRDVYYFNADNTISTRDKLSMSKLVTKVIILGKEDKEGRFPVEGTVTGDLRFGTLQEVVYRDGDFSLGDAAAEANEVLRQRGKPDEVIQIKAPDVPFLRKGDRIKVHAGNLYQTTLYIKGITHDMVNRTMTMECER